MRNLYWLAILALLVSGCATTTGPLSQKKFSSKEDPEYLQEIIQKNRQDYLKAHPQLKPETNKAIADGKLLKGMSKEEVKVSWGVPDIVYRSATNNIVNEQWLYKNIDALSLDRRNVYLNFKGDSLHSWFEQ